MLFSFENRLFHGIAKTKIKLIYLFNPSLFADLNVLVLALVLGVGLLDVFVVVEALVAVQRLAVVAILRPALLVGVRNAFRSVLGHADRPESGKGKSCKMVLPITSSICSFKV